MPLLGEYLTVKLAARYLGVALALGVPLVSEDRRLRRAAPDLTQSLAEALAAAWEQLRHKFLGDARTIEGLEAYTGREWIRTRRRDMISSYAVMTWDQLRQRPGLGLKKIRALVEMFAIAAQG